jgi:hypothetical protein
VTVRPGGEVVIPLKASTSGDGPVLFLLRQNPQAGTLEGYEQKGPYSAEIRYRHDGSTTLEDFFLYSAKSNSSGVSAPARVTIKVVDLPPKFKLSTSVIDFGEVAPGTRVSREFELRNEGGGRIEGELEIPEPWEIAGERLYQLGGGEKQTFQIIFPGSSVRVHRGRIRFSHDPTKAIELQANVPAPFDIVPSRIALSRRSDPIEISITNRRDTALEVNVIASEGLQTPERITLAPKESQKLAVLPDPRFLKKIEGSIELEAEGVPAQVSVTIPPVPGKLEFALPAMVQRVSPQGNDYQVQVTASNTGGTPIECTFLSTNDVVFLEGIGPHTLEPSEQKVLAVRVRTRARAGAQITLACKGPDGKSSIPLTLPEEPAAEPATHIAVRGAETTVKTPGTNRQSNSNEIAHPVKSLPFRVVARTTQSVTLEWPVTHDNVTVEKLERRYLSVGTDGLDVEWREVAGTPEKHGDFYRLTFDGLHPKEIVSVRPVTNGHVSWSTYSVRSAQSNAGWIGRHGGKILWIGLILTAVGAVWWLWQRKQQSLRAARRP